MDLNKANRKHYQNQKRLNILESKYNFFLLKVKEPLNLLEVFQNLEIQLFLVFKWTIKLGITMGH